MHSIADNIAHLFYELVVS